jgi:hypothetical protein
MIRFIILEQTNACRFLKLLGKVCAVLLIFGVQLNHSIISYCQENDIQGMYGDMITNRAVPILSIL